MGEIRGLWAEALPNVAFGDTRCAVTDGAVRREVRRPDQKLGGIIESRWCFDGGGVKLD